MMLKPEMSKYKVSIAVPVNWFPGNLIKSFEIVELSKKELTEAYLIDKAKEAGYTDFEVIGVILVAKGQAVSSVKKDTRKTSTK